MVGRALGSEANTPTPASSGTESGIGQRPGFGGSRLGFGGSSRGSVAAAGVQWQQPGFGGRRLGCLRALLTLSRLRKSKRGSIKTRGRHASAEKRGALLLSGVRLLLHGPGELCSHTRSIIRLKLASPIQPFETGGPLWETRGPLITRGQ